MPSVKRRLGPKLPVLATDKLYRVRCLGPGPEHQFWSPDPRKWRICRSCRPKLDEFLRLSVVQGDEITDGRVVRTKTEE